MSLQSEFVHDIQKSIQGEVRTDHTTRILYSTDASIYQIEPLGVVFPKTQEDLHAAVEVAARYQIPILPRGSGSSLAGQAIGKAFILDCSRYLNKIIRVDPHEKTAVVEPGAILSILNRSLEQYGLMFGPDPASADRATLGGCIANNAAGAHSISYGMTADHVLAVTALLSDGSQAEFQAIPLADAERRAKLDDLDRAVSLTVEQEMYRTALEIRSKHAQTVRSRWPEVWRRASGYNLNYLLPWSPSRPPLWDQWSQKGFAGSPPLNYPPVPMGHINLAHLIAGSEGTLAVMQQLTLRLVQKPAKTILVLLTFNSLAEACDQIPQLLSFSPAAVELIPGSLVRLARSVPAYAHQWSIIPGSPEAMLVVEFAGDNPKFLDQQVSQLRSMNRTPDQVFVLSSETQQQQLWNVRKVGLGLLMSRPGDTKPVAFIEDLAVPVENLSRFIREIQAVLKKYKTEAEFYAHASAGCLHIRPALNLKEEGGVHRLRSIAEEAVGLTLSMGGSISGEHGEGLARSEWLKMAYGDEIYSLFQSIKTAADPHNLLNPGKIVAASKMDADLRYGTRYTTRVWNPVLDFSRTGGVDGAIEMCNGAGVCRKDGGVMCPSFQASGEEMHSTRGRANLLRAMISGKFPVEDLGEEAVRQALDLCLACKGCKSECPSGVDMAKIKYEFTNHYYRTHPRKIRDYFFGYIGSMAPLASIGAPLLNWLMDKAVVRELGDHFFGVAAKRPLPKFHRNPASARKPKGPKKHLQPSPPSETVLFLADSFSHYFDKSVEPDALELFKYLGIKVKILPVMGAGRTLISKGFLRPARRHAQRLLDAIHRADPTGNLAVVGIEPSEIFTLRDEYLDFFPENPYVQSLSQRAWMVDEFLIRPNQDGQPRIARLADHSQPGSWEKKVLLHGHCYQKAQPPAEDGYPTGASATVQMLELVGFQVELANAGCCGMAGAFGYEAEHYQFSMEIGESQLFPLIRSAQPNVIVAAAGTSCRSQIEDGTRKTAVHPVSLLLNLDKNGTA